ncbi:MAG: hypothetical protein IJ307_05935 [Bacteroidales bacterium]|nr:hypothetical protein [Bacteroidales bacterium]
MDNVVKQPRTIFEQIVLAQEVTNDNVVALGDNLAVLNAKLDRLLEIFAPTSEPVASGADTMEQ